MNISNFIGHTVLHVIICKSSKFWFINKTTAKAILVWNFDLRIFSVYSHGARMSGRREYNAWRGIVFVSQANRTLDRHVEPKSCHVKNSDYKWSCSVQIFIIPLLKIWTHCSTSQNFFMRYFSSLKMMPLPPLMPLFDRQWNTE